MAAVYQRCPFCDRVFEIGLRDYEPMKRHIRLAHADDGSSVTDGTNGDRKRGTYRSVA